MLIQYELYPKQMAFVKAADRFTAFIAGVGSGKTFAGAAKALSHLKDGLGLIVAPTYSMLRDATLRTFLEVIAPLDPVLKRGEMIVEVAGSEVLCRSADNPDRLRGPNVAWAWIDEAGLCPRQTWEIVIGRLRQHGKAGACWITSTPKGRNWLYERIGEMTVFRAATHDNPYLDREFVRSLEASYTGKFADQELRGEFVGFEGQVYDVFSRERHVVERAGPWTRLVVGVDEGYTNPAVLLAVGFDADGRAHIVEEFYRRRVLQAEVVQAARGMAERYNVEAFIVDPSAAGLIADLRARGLPVQPADNAVFAGIQAVAGRLAMAGDGRPRLTVSPSCANTIAEFESYCWAEGRAGIKDMPEKVNDHAMDALRYAVMYVDRKADFDIAFA